MRGMNRTMITKHCPRCQTEIKFFILPDGTMTDPAPTKARPFVVKCCPKCSKKVLFWTGFKHVVNVQ